jgi:acyl carrier protein
MKSAAENGSHKTAAAVFRAVDKVNELLPESQQLGKERTTILLDNGTDLDSLSVINLLVFIEDEINTEFDRELTLTGEQDAVELPPEALRTLGGLIDALEQIVEAHG